jgi:carbamoyl-phosphate synthase large subunit
MRHCWRGCPEGRARILVTGAGGNVGQGILKALTAARIASWTVATDCEPVSAGLYAADRGYVVPRAEDRSFCEFLCRIVEKERINLILVGADAETIHLARLRARIEAETGAVVLVADPDAVERSHDKWLTAQWFAREGLPHPRSVRADDRAGRHALIDAIERVVVKPRCGYASRGLVVSTRRDEVEAIADRLGENGIVQEYVGSDDREFTGAVLCDRKGRVGASLVMQRDLLQGTSYRIQPVDDAELTGALHAWATRFAAPGPVNFQFRVTAHGPVCLEINARFSGTTGIRHLFGYNDAALAVRHFLFNEPIEQGPIAPGMVMRLWDEMHVPGLAWSAARAATIIEDGSPLTADPVGSSNRRS